MIGWIVRIAMSIAGVITGWFVASEATNFGLIQMVVAILLMTVFLAVAAFWPSLVAWFKSRRGAEDRTHRSR